MTGYLCLVVVEILCDLSWNWLCSRMVHCLESTLEWRLGPAWHKLQCRSCYPSGACAVAMLPVFKRALHECVVLQADKTVHKPPSSCELRWRVEAVHGMVS